MKKVLPILVLMLCVLFAACGHEHIWKEATCTEPKTCTECGAVEGEANGHIWNEADCITPKTCSVCGETDGKALGHNVESWTILEDSTCTTEGKQSGKCLICDKTVETSVPLKDHLAGDWVVSVAATENEQGTRQKSCVDCGEVLETEKFSLTPEEVENLYKSNCKNISYDKLSRTPDQYRGEKVKFRGRVLQVCSEASSALYYSTYRVATSGSYDNVMYIYVDNYDSGTRILEDDWITFYGEYDGLYSYTTVMGAEKTIPSVKAKYVD